MGEAEKEKGKRGGRSGRGGGRGRGRKGVMERGRGGRERERERGRRIERERAIEICDELDASAFPRRGGIEGDCRQRHSRDGRDTAETAGARPRWRRRRGGQRRLQLRFYAGQCGATNQATVVYIFIIHHSQSTFDRCARSIDCDSIDLP